MDLIYSLLFTSSFSFPAKKYFIFTSLFILLNVLLNSLSVGAPLFIQNFSPSPSSGLSASGGFCVNRGYGVRRYLILRSVVLWSLFVTVCLCFPINCLMYLL